MKDLDQLQSNIEQKIDELVGEYQYKKAIRDTTTQ